MYLTPCLVFAARKEGRYREPPPTPPGYVGIPIADFPEGPCHPARKPPDYNVALQRSRMVARPTEAPAPGQTPPAAAASRPGSKPQWHKPSDADPRLAPFQPQGFAGAEEDGRLPSHPTWAPGVTHWQLGGVGAVAPGVLIACCRELFLFYFFPLFCKRKNLSFEWFKDCGDYQNRL